MSELQSSLYECRIYHARGEPAGNTFTYSTFMFGLDLDELQDLNARSRVFGYNRARFFSLRDRDHFKFQKPEPGRDLRTRVEEEMRKAGLDFKPRRITLLTACRVLGYVFNPVSFYYIYTDESAAPAAVLAEVNNTFGEQKPYWVVRNHQGLNGRARKDFYVSPFIDHDVDFTFDLGDPGRQIYIKIESQREGRSELNAVLKGERREITDGSMISMALRHPLSTLFVIGRIHYQALKLFIKKVPWFGKDDMDERIAGVPAAGQKASVSTGNKNRSMKTV